MALNLPPMHNCPANKANNRYNLSAANKLSTCSRFLTQGHFHNIKVPKGLKVLKDLKFQKCQR